MHNQTSSLSLRWWFLILAVAVFVRLAIVYGYTLPLGERSPYAPFLFPDSLSIFESARSLADTATYIDAAGRQAWRTPGFALFWALWLKAGLASGIWLYLPNVLLGGLNALLAAGLGLRLFSARAGILAGLGAGVYPFLAFLDALPLADTIAVTTTLLLMAAGVWYVRAQSRGGQIVSPVAVGVAAALCAYTKASMGFLVIPMVLFLFFAARRKERGPGFARMAVVLVAFALAMLPWWSRNERIFGTFVPFSTCGGFTLWEATGPGADGGPNHDKVKFPRPWQDMQARQLTPARTLADNPDLHIAAALPGGGGVMQFLGSTKAELAADAYLLACCIQLIKSDPQRALRLGAKKFLRTWAPVPNWVNAGFWPYGLLMLISYVPLMLLALKGFFLFRADWRVCWMFAVPAVYLSVVHFVYMGSVRYRIPAEVCLLILAAGVADAMLRRRSIAGEDCAAAANPL